MTRDRRLLLLLGLLMAYGFFVVECRYHQREDATTTEVKHRHRHRHESSNRRGHHELDRKSWQEDYEYDWDSEDPIDEDDDYEARPYYDHLRSHHRSAQKSYHSRMLDPRHPSRYHNGGYHTGSGRYDVNNNDRRRILSRYDTKTHRYRPGRTYHRPAYSRNRDASDFDDDTEENYDYERPHRYGNVEVDKHERWRNSRRHTPVRRDWRDRMNGHHGARRHRLEDHEDVDRVDVTRWTDDWKGRSNSSNSKYHFVKDDRKTEEDEDYEDHGGLEEDDKDEDEDIWKGIADDRNEDNEEEEFDNDFHKSETKSPLKTYDDIIRRLTSDDPTTPKTTVKRDYRNIETNKHVKRDGYKNLKYDSRNVSRPVNLLTSTPRVASTTSSYFVNKRTAENSTVKSTGPKSSKNTVGDVLKGHDRQEGKIVDIQAKTKSLEQDYDEYPNSPDNEKEDDLAKAGVEDDSVMQADVTNTDYTDDDNGDEDEGDTFTTSSTTTTTTTTTTMRPKSSLNQHYDYKDPRAYDSSTGAQYNGYQAKNDYPPMSAHSIHKWQSLGTREGVKETRSNMQQYNKNGKSAEIREALQHAIKVNKEGSCQWPRARIIPVRDFYPSPSTTYIPHCAILHRCSDDTGCCKSEALTCVPKHSHRVELSFYTTSVGGASVVEKLSFYNHTECECKERSEYDTSNERSTDQRVYRHYQSSSPPQNIKKPPSRKPCRCPSEFTPRITLEGICQCNCYESNESCIKTKRGKGYFSLADRICIQNNECAIPNCEFGEYMKRQGKCPRKRDTFDAMANYRTNLNHRFRS